MASKAKTIIATGVSSALGLEAMKQLLQGPQAYRIILGARSIEKTQEAYDSFDWDKSANKVDIFQLELNSFANVKRFTKQVLDKVGNEKVDYFLMNAALRKHANEPGPYGSKWCEPLIVNHLSQHYMMHLLRQKLAADKARIVYVSSGAVRGVPDTSVMDKDLLANSGVEDQTIYCESKLAQLLGAQWWRRELLDTNLVVACSPGLILGTGLGRHTQPFTGEHPDAKSIPEGAASILAAVTREDIPEDPERMFLTSWGEWWPKDVYQQALDKELQDKWSPSKEQIEKEEKTE